jgi:predicted metal-dependent peptidase
MESFENRISAIYDKWFLTEPLYFNVMVSHRLVENNKIQTLRTGKHRIEYNRSFADSLSEAMLEEYLKIEIIRILLKHPYQRQPTIKKLGYIASDITISDNFQTNCKLFRYSDFWYYNLFQFSPFEVYYKELVRIIMPKEISSESLKDLSSQYQSETIRIRKSDADLISDFLKGMNKDKSGESANKRTFSQDQSDYKGFAKNEFEVIPGEEMGNLPNLEDLINADLWEEDELAVEEINSVIEMAELTNSWGTMPGTVQEKIKASLQVKLDYRKVLRRFRHSIISQKRILTRTKPNRRYEFDYMGSRYQFTTKLLVAVDTSGSVSKPDLQKALSVINQMFKYGIEICDVIQFDMEIKGHKQRLKKAQKEIAIKGRGGTNFQCVFNYLKTDNCYDGVIIITDGIAPMPVIYPGQEKKVLWLFNSRQKFDRQYPILKPTGRGCWIE